MKHYEIRGLGKNIMLKNKEMRIALPEERFN